MRIASYFASRSDWWIVYGADKLIERNFTLYEIIVRENVPVVQLERI